jgi:hypothetical protein
MASTSNPVDSPYIPEPLALNVVDLGWKVVTPKKSKKGKEKATEPASAPANDAAERKAAAAVRLLIPLLARSGLNDLHRNTAGGCSRSFQRA